MFSDFGKKLTGESGILQLMEDLGSPVPAEKKVCSLGGGNPAQIPEIEKLYRREMEKILADGRSFEDLIGKYDGPQGKKDFIDSVALCFSQRFGWNIAPENIAVCNGSQSACFYLFNLLAGTVTSSSGEKTRKKILFPLVPEYVGYADQGIESEMFESIPSRFEEYSDNTFKYFVDFEKLESRLARDNSIAALCVSRPTNPTGNVLTDTEVERMSCLAEKYSIPLIIDNAYGLPWPHIIFSDAKPFWNENIILSMSLSKIGLPSLRTGIIIARKEIAAALSNLNSIVSLASGSLGQSIAMNLIKSGELIESAARYVRPYYEQKNKFAQSLVHKYFSGTDYSVHKGEGSIFLWLLMRSLKITSKELYKKLKEQGVVVVPGEYFFFGNNGAFKSHPHYSKCIRINYACPDSELEEGIRIIAETYRRNS
ncbi:valine--pyruvate transaminase [Treponema sp.]|uniref:valine--pyruvate transaminase n=1 Tax=Treponema sp. TaxID=166 RepID=UPI003F0F4DC5